MTTAKNMEVQFCALLLMATAATAVARETKECVSYNMEAELYKAYQQALEEAASNTDTLYYLQRAFYPPDSPPAEVVTITVATVVNYIVNISWPYSLNQHSTDWNVPDSCYPAFTNITSSYLPSSPPPPWVRGLIHYDAYDGYCFGCDKLQWSKDTDSSSHLLLVKSIKGLLPLLNAFQTSIYNILYQAGCVVSWGGLAYPLTYCV